MKTPLLLITALWPVTAFAQLSDVQQPDESDGRDQRQENRALQEQLRNERQDQAYSIRQEQRSLQQDRQREEQLTREGSLDHRPETVTREPAARAERPRPAPAMRPR